MRNMFWNCGFEFVKLEAFGRRSHCDGGRGSLCRETTMHSRVEAGTRAACDVSLIPDYFCYASMYAV